jgi:beta-galactosidase
MTTEFTSHSADLREPRRFPWIADGFALGGDYSPEQWPESLWPEDIALMRRAGVNSVNLGVFSWGLLEVADGVFEWGWLDRIIDLLHEGGIGVNLATPTAAPPIWLLQAHPEIATVDEFGVRTSQGGRLAWSPSSATFRRYALRMARELAERYGGHPALRLWHVSNEIGNENARCYSDETARAFQAWLELKFGEIAELNTAWGTAFWGHHYTSFAQVLPPRHSRSGHNPGLLLDFERFTSDALLSHYLAEREVLREVTPHVPITTNFMIMNNPGVDDYRAWGREVDLVANDHYTIGADPERHGELAFSADRTRGVAGGGPWLLIEHSTSAVNWQPVNRAKSAGELARNSLAHIARGADGALFFQWRASSAGAEQFHSGIVPHAGPETKIFREVEQLGAQLRALAPVVGSTVAPARVAILVDQDSAYAWRSGRKPSELLQYIDLPLSFHRAFTAAAIAVDVISPYDSLDGYALVVVPTLYLATAATTEALTAYVQGGGHAVVSYLSGVVDQDNRVITGGYPGAFRDLLGVSVSEFFPLFAEQSVELDNGWRAALWTEMLETTGAEVLASYATGELAGIPALTRNTVGAGTATYLATSPDAPGMAALVADLAVLAGLSPLVEVEPGVEASRRIGDEHSYLFLINHTDVPRTARASGVDLVSGARADGSLVVPAGAVVVLEEAR